MEHRGRPVPRDENRDYFNSQPLNNSSVQSALPLTPYGVAERDFSQVPTRDITREPSPSNDGRQSVSSAHEIPTTGNKTIKITFEDSNTSKPPPKKSDPHPQEKLEKFWNVFEPEYLGKITRILPTTLIESTPATSKQAGDKSHRASTSYSEARARCIRDVKRIIRECRTHNKKYTDTHFDIERDLKITRRRDCLDGLYNTTNSSHQVSDRSTPTDVKRVCDIFENPTFFAEGATYDDIIQGSLGDCWLLAAFSILTCNDKFVKDICVIQDVDIGVYGFVFYRDGDWHQCIIDDKLYLRAPSYDESGDVVLGMYGVQQRDQEQSYNDLFQKGSKSLYFAQCRNENETWVPLLEKALAKAHGSYGALSGGQTGEAIEDLTGGVTTEIYTTNILNKNKFWYDELRKIGSDFVFSAAAASYREWRAPHSTSVRNERRQGIVSQHAYAILDTFEGHGQRLVKMRNPWGSSEWTGPWSDGSKEWNSEWFERLNHKFGDDGIFWISYEDMLRKYKYVDRTRIFGPEWHVAQQWTSVQVPWNTTDYQQTRFQIDVPETTEAVIVISQLDDRYYQGLQGRYDYTLQFRIQRDDDEEDEYFARSPRNYELVRSNNVEVELEKGRYTVLFKAEARKTNRKDVEAVIRENIWRKEKLMQIGTLYDLAHQKGQQNTCRKPEATEIDPKDNEKNEEKKNEESSKEENNKDPNRDPWNAFCVVGLRVYSKQQNMGLKVLHPDGDEETAGPVLDRDDIAKAPLQEAQHNSEQTPEGSVDGEQGATTEKPAENKPSDKPAPATESKPAGPVVTVTIGNMGSDQPTTTEDKAAEESMESSQVMDDLAGDKNGCS
ncbi:hypothetical protein PMZ80_006043 [Knufia obscura]|uniref:Calpain catalytic domain-containing protein n=2 Tax=Knufia TaxID=430999 RepID=A0AAN8EMI0_9EURO|nr:hypothetical protein PMZ80_006043 [Knufia obscura]KAK5954713.1 hypothetical protein OHC33_004437 [Knufia fluminis]